MKQGTIGEKNIKLQLVTKRIVIILIATVTVLLLLVNFFRPANSFILRMSGYFAAEEQSESSIAFTCLFGQGRMFKPSDVAEIYFDGENEKVKITSFDIKQEKNINSYRKYSIYLDIAFMEKGQDKAEFLIVELKDGSKINYPIGQWFFDIDEKEPVPPILNTWESPAVSSDGNNFAYSYFLNKGYSAARIQSIQVGENDIFEAQAAISTEGKISLTDSAPIKYIRAKMLVEYNGQMTVAYGKGSYCGAMNIDTSLLDKMKEFVGVRSNTSD